MEGINLPILHQILLFVGIFLHLLRVSDSLMHLVGQHKMPIQCGFSIKATEFIVTVVFIATILLYVASDFSLKC